jgi:threonine dehydratase
VAVNALGATRIGQICFDLTVETGMISILVSDTAILQAQQLLWSAHRQLVEPSGATALAALTSGAYVPASGEKVAVLVCGANIDPNPLP